MGKKAIVIGSGVAGLAAAIRLNHAGFEVTVFESNSFIGGKINSEKIGDYRFDMGPSVFTGPQYIKDLYDLCGKDFKTFEYIKLTESFHYFYPDGTNFKLSADKEKQLETLSTVLGEDKLVLQKYLNKSENNYKLIAPLFIEVSLSRIKYILNRKLFKALWNIPKYKLNSTMHAENSKAFKNKKTVQFFDRFATYNGSDPYQAPAMLNMIANLELNIGAFLPKNGMVQITQSLYDLALEKGVQFQLNEKVTKIIVENKITKGVETSISCYDSDVVFSNMDVALTYKHLLSNQEQPTKILSQEKSSSALVFYWGIKKEFKELGLHNILFSDNYKQEFDDIFLNKKLNSDPTIYINITSKHVKSDAPEGCENWFTMINMPITNGTNDSETVAQARKILIDKINKILKTDIEALIEIEHVMSPNDIQRKYSADAGSIYGNASNNKFSTFYRHANFSKKIKGLYFVGVTVHPGGGIPLALNSAKIATECMIDDYEK